MSLRTFCVVSFAVATIIAPAGLADSITSGNILVSTEEVLYEYSPAGAFVQSILIPDYTGEIPNLSTARDIAVKSGSDTVHVFNGTFDPYLSTIDWTGSTWTHTTFDGWSIGNNVANGGVAVTGDYIFVTDMSAGTGTEQGIVRFELGDDTIRFADTTAPIDLNMGLNGLLYALEAGTVRTYNPQTLALVNTYNINSTIGVNDYRSVAANAAGDMFVVDWDGDIHKTDSSGNGVLTVSLVGIAQTFQLIDVDVSGAGTVIVGDTAGGVTVTNESLSSPTNFTVGTSAIFVGVQTSAPVPVTLSTFTLE